MRSPLPVMSSILPCPPCFLHGWGPRAGGSRGRGCGGRGWGGGFGGRGQGTFHPPCKILHHHMVLRPEGTSHNEESKGKNGVESPKGNHCTRGLTAGKAQMIQVTTNVSAP